MSTYVIGDVQGCFEPLMQLLDQIQFSPRHDNLIFCGDLVNRGGRSLDVLRWIYAHQYCCDTVLGNHDLSLLSKYHSNKLTTANKEFNQVFKASDSKLLMNWLLSRPLFLETAKHIVVHAGVYPFWGTKKFKKLALSTQASMLSDPQHFFSIMYGNSPKVWSKELDPDSSNRFVINACTRMRFIKKNGTLNFSENKRAPKIKSLIPWFEINKKRDKHVVFGHWSALGLFRNESVTCLDTGKVWGGKLTALCLDDDSIISV